MGKLKPCPFCGGKVYMTIICGIFNCEECGARVEFPQVAYEDRVAAWNRRAEAKKTRKCGECQYLNTNEKHSVGFPCLRPNHYWRTMTAHFKQKHTPACKAFKPRDDRGTV